MVGQIQQPTHTYTHVYQFNNNHHYYYHHYYCVCFYVSVIWHRMFGWSQQSCPGALEPSFRTVLCFWRVASFRIVPGKRCIPKALDSGGGARLLPKRAPEALRRGASPQWASISNPCRRETDERQRRRTSPVPYSAHCRRETFKDCYTGLGLLRAVSGLLVVAFELSMFGLVFDFCWGGSSFSICGCS